MDDYSDRPGCIQLGRVARRTDGANRTVHLSTTAATTLVMVVLVASMVVSRA